MVRVTFVYVCADVCIDLYVVVYVVVYRYVSVFMCMCVVMDILYVHMCASHQT